MCEHARVFHDGQLPTFQRRVKEWRQAAARRLVFASSQSAATVSTVSRAPEVKPLLGIPVTILVSERTASAAEAVAYTLQRSKPAVAIGSRTKGMANAPANRRVK